LLATLCVALSLGLVALGGADPTSGFYLRTLRIGRPMTKGGPILDTIAISCVFVDLRTLGIGRPTIIVGPVLDTVAVSYVCVAGAMCEECKHEFIVPCKCPLVYLLGCDTARL
jgi:hypothetical protein